MIRRWIALCAAAAPLWGADVATPDAILKFHDASMAAVKSWQANFIRNVLQGTNIVSQSGTVRYLRLPNGVECGRADFVMQIVKRELNHRIIAGPDGIVWQVVNVGERTGIYKLDLNRPITGSTEDPRKLNPVNEVNPVAILGRYRPQLDFTTEPVVELGGRRHYPLVGRPKANLPPGALPLGAMRFWIGAADGFPHRVAFYDLAGNPVQAMDLSALRLNIALEDGLFSYTPPEGANIQDLNARLGKALQ
jgi:outer membrane lipoprotein-sorting protein